MSAVFRRVSALKAWRKKFASCKHKFVDPSLRCSHRPNGNPMCDQFVSVRCRYAICPKRKERGA